jgi:phage-related protein
MFKKFIVQFLVNPICEDIESTEYIVTSNSDSFEIDNATSTMYPTIEITGQGDISVSINNSTFNLYDIDGLYILNCKEKIITSNSINASNKMQYDFPSLIPGLNQINYVGNISEFKIIYKKAYM